jgi:hypothetical protein
VGYRLETEVVVRAVQTHGLFRHCRLESVLGGLVVVAEGDEGSTDPKQHRGMDLAMCVLLELSESPCGLFDLQVGRIHGDQCTLLFLDIKEFN